MAEKILEAILKKYKDSAIKTADQIKLGDLDPISTGSLSLDLAMGIPLTYGIVEYAGMPGVGKTTLALEAVGNAQKKGYNTFYFNIERAINEKSFLGLNIDKKGLNIIYPESGEAALNIAEQIIRQYEKNFIVIDSVASVISEKVLSEGVEKETMGGIAKMMGVFLNKTINLIHRSKTVLLLVNQLRVNMGYGSPFRTPGGDTIKYLADERIWFKTTKSDRITGEEENDFKGHIVEAEIVKNRFNPPFKKANFPIIYLPGPHIDKNREIANLSMELALVEIAGAWIKLPDGRKIQGKESYIQLLNEDKKLYNEIETKLLEIVRQ